MGEAGMELRIAPKGQPAKKSRQAVGKRSCDYASNGEPIPKKARRESEAEASMAKVVPPSVEKQGDKEEEEEAPVLRSRGLRSKGPVILEEGELAGELVMAEEVERPKIDLVRKDDVEILGVSTQPGPSSAHGRRLEVQKPGSPSVLISTSRVIEPSPTTGVLSGKVSIAETSCVELSSSSSEEHGYYSGEEVDFGDKPTLPDTSKFSHISEEEIQGYDPVTASLIAMIATTEGIFFVFLNRFPIKLGMSFNISF